LAIITISRGSYSRGKRIAEKVAAKLGYECIAREALLEASKEYDIPEAKLVGAMHDAPSRLDRFVGGKDKYIAYIQTALTDRVKKDNVVYHGLAGHFLLKGISHVLKVRIIAPMDYRVKVIMRRDEVSKEEALRILMKDDEERFKWSRKLYGIDQTDSSLYDLVLNVDKISVDGAVDIICGVAKMKPFKATPESRKAMADLALASAVKSHLIALKPDIQVQANDGVVTIRTGAYAIHKDAFAREIKSLAASVPGVKKVNVRISTHIRFHA
jgi:cytidylate kinase